MSRPTRHVPVIVLGAGLTGLSASLELTRLGVSHRVLERSGRVGGHATTRDDDGYRFDCTGHLLHLRSDALRAEVLDWLDGDCLDIERKSVVFSHGVYTRYPFQANTLGLPPQIAYDCLMGFVQAQLAQPERPPRNFEEFCLAHFGAGFSRHFLLPYNQKLWGVPPSEIGSDWCTRFVPLPNLSDVIAGAVGLPDPKLGYNARFLYPRRGIGALPEALARRVPAVSFRSAPRLVRAERRELVLEDDEAISYDVLLSTAPLPSLLASFDALPSEVEAARARLRATSLYYLDLALGRPLATDFHWAYVPEERYPFYRVGSYSAFSPEMAPRSCSSLYVELASRERPELSTVMPDVVRGLVDMGVITSGSDIAFSRVRRLEYAYVIYDDARASALETIERFLQSVRAISTGRYGAWNYSSMEDALAFGRDAARQAASWLTR
jgi:protoporphyrinogen oxidase